VTDVISVIIGVHQTEMSSPDLGVSRWTMMISMIRSAINIVASASLAANFE
jgi:hypothetical protein